MNLKAANKRFKSYPGYKALIAFVSIITLSVFLWIGEAAPASSVPTSGQPVELFSTETKNDLCQSFAASIHSAKKSVHLIIYSLSDPKIIAALRQKSEEGAEVRVVIDAKTSPHIEKKLGPKVKVVKRFNKTIMHQKILTIDEKLTWLGSANMTGESLRHHGNLVGAIDSESLAKLIKDKTLSFTANAPAEAFPHRNFNIGGQEFELWFLPDDNRGTDRIVQLIRSAQKCIKVAMFTWTRKDFAQELVLANRRGVCVEVAIDRNSASNTSEKIVKFLAANGIPVSLSQGSALLHHKFMYIDGKVLVNGSANWTKSAFSVNDDCFFVLHGLNGKQREFMDKVWNAIIANSKPVNSSHD